VRLRFDVITIPFEDLDFEAETPRVVTISKLAESGLLRHRFPAVFVTFPEDAMAEITPTQAEADATTPVEKIRADNHL
jgi:hypothetical protein